MNKLLFYSDISPPFINFTVLLLNLNQMKYYSLLLVFLIFQNVSNSQVSINKKYLNFAIDINVDINNSTAEATDGTIQKSISQNFGVYPLITFGKINKKSVLFSYGLSLGVGFSKSKYQIQEAKTISYKIAPALTIQRFFPITTDLNYCPIINCFIGYAQSYKSDLGSDVKNITSTYFSSAEFAPFAINYKIGHNNFLLFYLGEISLSYSHQNNYVKPQMNNIKLYANNLNFSAHTNSIRFGIQKKF